MELSLESNKIYDENELINIIKTKIGNSSDANIRWTIFKLLKSGLITKVSTKKYKTNAKIYDYEFKSVIATEINNYLAERFPLINYIIWDNTLCNEWINLLIAKNIIIIEVEKEFVEDVFFFLMDTLGDKQMILLNPDEDMIYRYLRNDLIIVKTLYSRSPIRKKDHKTTIEKLMIDIISDKTIFYYLDENAKAFIIQGVISQYDINEDRLNTYASRRRCLDKLKYYKDFVIYD